MEQRISESGANGSTGYRESEKEERTSSKRLCLRISLSNGSLLFLRFSSPFRRACSSFSDSFVPTVRRSFWILHNSNSIVSFQSVRSSFSDSLVLLQLFVACSQSLQPIGKRMQKQLRHQLLTRDARKAGTKPGRGVDGVPPSAGSGTATEGTKSPQPGTQSPRGDPNRPRARPRDSSRSRPLCQACRRGGLEKDSKPQPGGITTQTDTDSPQARTISMPSSNPSICICIFAHLAGRSMSQNPEP